jgi:hypothetical protein
VVGVSMRSCDVSRGRERWNLAQSGAGLG